MTLKRKIYSHQNLSEFDPGPGSDDDMHTGHPNMDEAENEEQVTGQKAKKGHAAYSAFDEMSPFTMRNGNLRDLFGNADEAKSLVEEQSPDGSLLSIVPDDALAAECARRICPDCPTRKELDDARLRALADLDNTKKRLERERVEQIRFATERVLSDIIPSLDNLDLALQHATANPACEDFVTGVRMTRKLMQDALAAHGLRQVGEPGEEFNPAVHEAVGMVMHPDVAEGHVCALLSNGYKLHDRLLRPARVMVCKKNACDS